MDTVRWGLLSTANINKKLIPAIRASSRGELTAVGSRSGDRAEEYAARWNIPLAYPGYNELLHSGEIDAVYISLPNHLHAEWTIRALKAGVHVLCEKPLALSVEEVEAMTEVSGNTGCVLAEAFMYRHHPQTELISDWIQDHRLGEIVQLRGSFNFYLGDQHRQTGNLNIRLQPACGGGSLWDVGVYPVSLVQYLMGRPPEWVIGHQDLGPTGVDESFSGILSYSSPGEAGPAAQISCSFRTPFRTTFEISGTAGHLVITRPFTNLGREHPLIYISEGGQGREIKPPEKDLYLGEVEDFNRAVLDGVPPTLSLDESRDHIQTVQALYQSARTGKLVKL